MRSTALSSNTVWPGPDPTRTNAPLAAPPLRRGGVFDWNRVVPGCPADARHRPAVQRVVDHADGADADRLGREGGAAVVVADGHGDGVAAVGGVDVAGGHRARVGGGVEGD